MAPKIEELPKQPPRNPFIPQEKKKTIRRDAKQIYNNDQLRKGLNKIELNSKTPLDKLFLKLESQLEGDLNDLTITILSKRLDINTGDEFARRFLVIQQLMNYILEIQELSSQVQHEDKNLIVISLHDIKTFSKLINLIIILGIYPALGAFNIGIPLAKRRLNEFSKTRKQVVIDKLPPVPNATTLAEKYRPSEKLLTLIYGKFKEIFRKESDVQDLLIKGTGYSDFLTVSITLITCPYFEEAHRKAYANEFQSFVLGLPGTYELFQTFSLLLASPSPPFFRNFVLDNLQSLHYNCPRNDGLLTLVEFVLGLRDSEDINVERFDNVANIVLQKPKSINTALYFSSIGSQCYDILVNINRPLVGSCICYVLDRLWNKNQMVVQDFFLKKIWYSLSPQEDLDTIEEGETMVSEKDFNNAINVLISLSKGNLQPDFLKYLFEPIVLALWSYYTFLNKKKRSKDVVLNILVSFFTACKDSEDQANELFGLDKISRNLLFEHEAWELEIGPNGLPMIAKKITQITKPKESKVNSFIDDLDLNCKAFITLLTDLDDNFVLQIFIKILRRWLNLDNRQNLVGSENPFLVLIDLRLIESIASQFRESIAKTPSEILSIVKEFLNLPLASAAEKTEAFIVADAANDDEDSDDEDDFDGSVSETYPLLLELLSAVLSEVAETAISENCHRLLEDISKRLKYLLEDPTVNITTEHKKPTISLLQRMKVLLEGEAKTAAEEEAHKQILTRAITNLNDPLVPIRAHGLFLLRQLMELNSQVISVDFVTELHLVQLKDNDPFIYLNVIKGLESLLKLHSQSVLAVLVGIYTNETNDIDERLRIGEVLLRFVNNSNELFTGPLAKTVVSATLAMISRFNANQNQDDRIRMSAMSLLGVCCKVNPLAIIDDLENALDCALGILQLETDNHKAIMRRAAVVLLHDLLIGTSSTSAVPFPDQYRSKVVTQLEYIKQTDTDLLTREQATTVLNDINELTSAAFQLLEETLAGPQV